MNQSAYIAAALIAGFFLYLAANDRLRTYAGVLWGNTAAPTPGGESGGGVPSESGQDALQGQAGSAAGAAIGNMILPGIGGPVGSMIGGSIGKSFPDFDLGF